MVVAHEGSCDAGVSMHRAPIPSTLSRQQLAPADSLGPPSLHADAPPAPNHADSGMQTPFQTEQRVGFHAEISAARPVSTRLFPDTAKGHMAMVCCFGYSINMLLRRTCKCVFKACLQAFTLCIGHDLRNENDLSVALHKACLAMRL